MAKASGRGAGEAWPGVVLGADQAARVVGGQRSWRVPQWPEPTCTGQTGPETQPSRERPPPLPGEKCRRKQRAPCPDQPGDVGSVVVAYGRHRNLSFSGASVRGPVALDTGPCVLHRPGTRRAASVTVPSAQHPMSWAAVGQTPWRQLHFGTVSRDSCAGRNTLKKCAFPGDDVTSPWPRIITLYWNWVTKRKIDRVYFSVLHFSSTFFHFL